MFPNCKAAPLCLFLLLTVISPVKAEMRDQTKIKAGTPPAVVLKEIFRTNQMAMRGTALAGSDSKFAPYLTWLADPDPRVQPEAILPSAPNTLYAVRNLGNQVTTSPGSLDYGILYLHTPVLLITANTDNQAIKLAMANDGNLEPELRRELERIRPAFSHDNPKEPLAERLRKNIEANVDYQVEQAMSRYGERIQSGRLAVVGTILDLTNEYRRGLGRLIVINVNGEKEATAIRALQHLAPFDGKTLDLYIGRYRAEPPLATPSPSSQPKSPPAAEPEEPETINEGKD